jgi:hypothetical protein
MILEARLRGRNTSATIDIQNLNTWFDTYYAIKYYNNIIDMRGSISGFTISYRLPSYSSGVAHIFLKILSAYLARLLDQCPSTVGNVVEKSIHVRFDSFVLLRIDRLRFDCVIKGFGFLLDLE